MGKVKKFVGNTDSWTLLSQTPKNYSKDNYYFKTLQDKVNAEWPYRHNRVDVEYETSWGEQKYDSMEVIVQPVKSDKGSDFAIDTRRLVFRDIRESRFRNGSRFRFRPDYGENVDAKDSSSASIWIVTNFENVKPTASAIVVRCNGTLASLYTDPVTNVSSIHYEPVIQTINLTNTVFNYNDDTVTPKSSFTAIVQHNDYTKNYYINQRFVIGYDKVYRIVGLDKFYGLETFDPHNVGLMKVYFELTETSVYDNFDTRLAYNTEPRVIMSGTEDSGVYEVRVVSPTPIPTDLTSDPVKFEAYVYKNGSEVMSGVPITFSYELANLPETVSPSSYVIFETDGNNSFTVSRKRMYLLGDLTITCTVQESDSPTGKEFGTSFKLAMNSPV